MKLTRNMPKPVKSAVYASNYKSAVAKPVSIVRENGRTKFFENATGSQITRYQAIQLMRAYKQGGAEAPVQERKQPTSKFLLVVECHDMQGTFEAYRKEFVRRGNAERMLVKLVNEASARTHAEQRAVSVSFKLTEVK